MRTGVLCTILVLCTVIVFIPVTVKFFSVANERSNVYTQYELADFPLLTLQELKSEFYRVSRLIAEPVGDNADGYYIIHKQVLDLQYKMRKYKTYNRGYSLEVNHIDGIIASSLNSGVGRLNQDYREKFGITAMQEAASSFVAIRDARERKAVIVPFGAMPSYVGTWQLFVTSCLLSLLPMFLLNIVRIKRTGLLLWPELATVRIVLATIAWPVTCFFYPTCIVRKDQVMLAGRVLAYGLSAVFSFGVVGIGNAQTKTKKKEKKNSNTVQVIGKDFNLNIEGFPVTADGKKDRYFGTDYTWELGDHFTGSGFLEAGENPFFTLNTVTADIPGPVDATFEQGYGPMGHFSRVGLKIPFNDTPVERVTSKVFKFVTFLQVFRVTNEKAPTQSGFVWKTKSLNVGEFQLLSQGFYRIGLNNKPDLAQPQIVLQLGRWMFILELWLFGGDFNPMLGMRYSF